MPSFFVGGIINHTPEHVRRENSFEQFDGVLYIILPPKSQNLSERRFSKPQDRHQELLSQLKTSLERLSKEQKQLRNDAWAQMSNQRLLLLVIRLLVFVFPVIASTFFSMQGTEKISMIIRPVTTTIKMSVLGPRLKPPRLNPETLKTHKPQPTHQAPHKALGQARHTLQMDILARGRSMRLRCTPIRHFVNLDFVAYGPNSPGLQQYAISCSF